MYNGLFQKGVAEGKSAVTPLSCKLYITIDYTFKMRYITSLNSWLGSPYLDGFVFCSFNFDGLYFWNQREFGDPMYLILKV